jgi:hypothetical protein
MGIIFVLLAGVVDPLAMSKGMDPIPIQRQTLRSTDLTVPISDSLRAATWDELSIKPSEPVHIQVACIVAAKFGAPGSCVPASDIASESKTINWANARDSNDRWASTANPADVDLFRVATERVQMARIPVQSAKKTLFVVRFFDEVISPSDARPSFVSKDSLTMNDIILDRPIDSDVLRRLYPVLALRNGVAGRVSMACDIQDKLTLLCRDPGKVDISRQYGPNLSEISKAFIFATYQFVSTFKIMPKDKFGNSVIGRQLKFAISWQLPE